MQEIEVVFSKRFHREHEHKIKTYGYWEVVLAKQKPD